MRNDSRSQNFFEFQPRRVLSGRSSRAAGAFRHIFFAAREPKPQVARSYAGGSSSNPLLTTEKST